jgi:hypothetical protein
MRLIIAGTRDLFPPIGFIDGAIRLLEPYTVGPITEIVSGTAHGVDSEGEHWASHMSIPVKRFPAEWENTVGQPVPNETEKWQSTQTRCC